MDERALTDIQLEGAELVYRRGVAPDITYDFKHALVQDAAWSIDRGRRFVLNCRIGSVP